MSFRFRKSFRIAPGLSYALTSGGRKGARQQLTLKRYLVGLVATLVIIAGFRSCGAESPSTDAQNITPAVSLGSAEARLAEIERKKVEAKAWEDAVSRFDTKFAPVITDIKAASRALSVDGGWDEKAKRAVVRAVLASGDADAFLDMACQRVHDGGFQLVEGAWTRVQVEIPPATKGRSGEKWASVADAVNTERAWRGCPGTADVAPDFWREVGAMPGFVDLYGGRPQLDADVVPLVVRTSGEEERLRLVVAVCKAAKAAGLKVGHVKLHSAPPIPEDVHWRGTLYKC